MVLAAGLGRRFGGMKQVAAVDDARQTLIDYGVFDAIRAGFDKVICVITPEMEREFHERVGANIARNVDLRYAHQRLDALPPGFSVPPGRTKPWGTAQAVLAALPQVPGSFATVNADDFYGTDAYEKMAAFLAGDSPDHAVVGYDLANTLSSNGTVSRGVCQASHGRLVAITEHTALQQSDHGVVDETGCRFDNDTPVSMNFWGFRASAKQAFAEGFSRFLSQPAAATAEYYLPDVGGSLIPHVRVLSTDAKWLGITYAADLQCVRDAIADLLTHGAYPLELWA